MSDGREQERPICLVVVALLLFGFPCCVWGSLQLTSIQRGFKGTQMNYIDHNNMILHSNNSQFYFGFQTLDSTHTTQFLLVVIHQTTKLVVWTANRGSPISNADNLVFDDDGDAKLFSGKSVVWSTNTTGDGAVAIELMDSGNLVLRKQADGGKGKNVSDSSDWVWQSFDHPTDTLLPGQEFREGMDLTTSVADVGGTNELIYSLRILSGSMTLQANFQPPQTYWSVTKDRRVIIDASSSSSVGKISKAEIVNNSWNIYDGANDKILQLVISPANSASNYQYAAVLNSKDGSMSFFKLNTVSGERNVAEKIKIPSGVCDVPQPCQPYSICSESSNVRCSCLSSANSRSICNPKTVSPCSLVDNNTDVKPKLELIEVKQKVGYFATVFIPPTAKSSNLTNCKELCSSNCSCLVMFFDQDSGDCFLFDQIGSLQESTTKKNYTTFIKISSSGNKSSEKRKEKKHIIEVVLISVLTSVAVAGIIFCAVRFHQRRETRLSSSKELISSDDDDFLGMVSGMPTRYSYKELYDATDKFSVKLGQGGFGSVYRGKLPDGSSIAVKKLEGIGQGKKEFRAEVSIIGSIHHVHLVRLRGFCAEGSHRLLAYEFMENNSLDKWIFARKKMVGNEEFLLDWNSRFNIALGTAKGLAYLHEDCESKIVHCDIKPENVLLDDKFQAKVSDFGLAKLMTREQSHVFTTLRGTRGYLAPEWIINSAISEKSDVYSYGMVLLEIIGGRKNFDHTQSSEMAHFPSYAFKMLEEGKLREVVDTSLQRDCDERMEVAIRVALWCIQEDMNLRPSMSRVVQMLEGIAEVPIPPASSQMGFRLHANLFKSISEEGGGSWDVSSSVFGSNSEAYLSAVRLSGAR